MRILHRGASGEVYSRVRHYGESIFISQNSLRCWLFMYSVYFDRSRCDEPPVTVVGGYLATVEEWVQFDIDWRLLLAKENLPYFHMKEFAHSQKAFCSGWKDNEEKRSRFLADLVDITASHATISFSAAVKDSEFAEVDREYEFSPKFGNPYSYCARLCAGKVRQWMKKTDMRTRPSVTFSKLVIREEVCWRKCSSETDSSCRSSCGRFRAPSVNGRCLPPCKPLIFSHGNTKKYMASPKGASLSDSGNHLKHLAEFRMSGSLLSANTYSASAKKRASDED